MSSINILGAACVDLLLSTVEKEKFFSGKYKVGSMKSRFGGDGLNQAIDLSRMGNDVSFSFLAGKDMYGDAIKAFLDENRVNYKTSSFKDDVDTYLSLVMIMEDGEHLFVGNENGSLRLFDLNDIFIDEDCRIVSFGSLFISKKMDTEKYERLFSSVKEKGKILCVDCSTPKNGEHVKELSYLKYIDHFFCNIHEAKMLCACDDLFECEKMFKEAGAYNVIIKLGKDGCLYNGKVYSPEDQIKCIDSTGAGDAFVSGYIHSLNKGENMEKRLSFANHCGGMACQYIGANEWSAHLLCERDMNGIHI